MTAAGVVVDARCRHSPRAPASLQQRQHLLGARNGNLRESRHLEEVEKARVGPCEEVTRRRGSARDIEIEIEKGTRYGRRGPTIVNLELLASLEDPCIEYVKYVKYVPEKMILSKPEVQVR